MNRFYYSQAADEPNSYHVYDRETPNMNNEEGRECVHPYLSLEEAQVVTSQLNCSRGHGKAITDPGRRSSMNWCPACHGWYEPRYTRGPAPENDYSMEG